MPFPSRHLGLHGLEVAIVHPQIAPNVGNIGRTCVATGTPLHLVRPLGFVLSDKHLKRAGMDYWGRLKLTVHDDFPSFLRALAFRRLWFFDSAGARDVFQVTFSPGDVLVFGSETRGIDPAILATHLEQTVFIPQVNQERCLNLATSVGVALYLAIGQGGPNGNSPLIR